jgi:hypothetical protein
MTCQVLQEVGKILANYNMQTITISTFTKHDLVKKSADSPLLNVDSIKRELRR